AASCGQVEALPRREASARLAERGCVFGRVVVAQEHVVGGIWHDAIVAFRFACSLEHPALGVDALDDRDIRQQAIAAALRHLALEPRYVLGAGAGRARTYFRLHAAAI